MSDHIHNLNHLKNVRRVLRRDITPEEKILWFKLRNNTFGFRFRRQHSIGNFVADFFCPVKRLIIELDGSQHLDSVEYDKERTEFFESFGIRVIRFWNNDVNTNINGVIMKIEEELKLID